MTPDEREALSAPFSDEQIETRPQSASGPLLTYVGHAGVTMRLLAVDPAWSWEPLAFDDFGLPRLDDMGGLWIKLTVCGVTRYGYGDSPATGTRHRKELIGDAIRNAAIRFGVATYLWSKSDESLILRNEEPTPRARKVREPKPAARKVIEPLPDAVMQTAHHLVTTALSDKALQAIYNEHKAGGHLDQEFTVEATGEITTLRNVIVAAKAVLDGAE